MLRRQRPRPGEQGGAEPGRAVPADRDAAAEEGGQGGRERRGRVQDRLQPETSHHSGIVEFRSTLEIGH